MSREYISTCPLCEATCGIVVNVEGDKVTSIRGDDRDAFSRGYLCPKAAALKDLHEDPDRLKTPVRRTATGHEPISWKEAFDETVRQLCRVQQRFGKNALAIYQGNPTVHSLGAMTYGQLFAQQIRTHNRFSATSADQLPQMLASLQMFGHQLLLPVPDLDRTDLLVILGGNPAVSNGSIMTAPGMKRRLAEIRTRGGKVVVVDPRRTETAALADEHLFIRPGTDALLLCAMIQAIFDAGKESLGRLASFTEGVDVLRDVVRRFPAEEVADAVGIGAERIRSLALEVAGAHRACVYGRVGLCTQEFGGTAAWLLYAINIVTGNLDRAGGFMFTTPAFDLVAAMALGGRTGSFGRWRSRVRDLPEFGGELPVSVMAEEIDTEGPDQIRALITHAGNPVLSIPNGARLDAALERLEFMVSIDFYINETTRHADIILPPTGQLERDHYDIAFNALAVRNVAKFAPAVFKRAPDQRHDWEIFLELATRMHAGSPAKRGLAKVGRLIGRRLGPRPVLELAFRLGPQDVTMKKLLQRPHGMDLGPLEPRLPDVLSTKHKRILLVPELYVRDLDRLASRTREMTANRGLTMIGRRHLRSNNSWLHNSHRLVKGKPPCTLLMHPDDAKALGLTDGQDARVASRTGSVVAPIELTGDMMPGVVSLPHGWGHGGDGVKLSVAREHAGVSSNDVTDETVVDELSGNAVLNGVPVTVEAV